MINFNAVNRFCCENICLIENYDKAINDTTQTWHCHHRLETDKNLSRQYLIDNDLYYNRSVSELIFLTPSEHQKLHKTGKPRSEEAKRKQSESMKGKNNPMYGNDKFKGKNNPMYGKPSATRGKHRVYRDDGSYYMSF